MERWVAVWVLASLALAPARPSFADDAATESARALMETGLKHYNLGHFSDALGAFEAAYMAKPVPAFLFNIGQCHRQLGDFKEEIYAYRRYLAGEPDSPNRVEVEKFIAAAEAELARRHAEAPPVSPIATLPSPSPSPVVTAPSAPPAAVSLPPPSETPAPAPLYRRWWVWTAAAAVVVVVAGVALGVATASPATPDHPGDSAGSATVRF